MYILTIISILKIQDKFIVLRAESINYNDLGNLIEFFIKFNISSEDFYNCTLKEVPLYFTHDNIYTAISVEKKR